MILDGENAWEYYPGNGREFLRHFYGKIEHDSQIRALTASEAIEAAPDPPRLEGIFPASWISANFDVWIGHSEDVRAWDLLRDARRAFERAKARGNLTSPFDPEKLTPQGQRAYEAVLASEGSDWCWWYGPEHASANDADFDRLYRKHLTDIYNALGESAPDSLAQPIKHAPERARREAPTAFLDVQVDGRESSYFEWLGAGLYATDRRSGAMHGRQFVLGDFYYGFGAENVWIRVDPIAETIAAVPEFQLRLDGLGFARDANYSAHSGREAHQVYRGARRLVSAASRGGGVRRLRKYHGGGACARTVRSARAGASC